MNLVNNLLESPKIIWEATAQTVIAGAAPKQLSGAWKLMLLGDGSPTRHLKLLTGHEVAIKLIAMEKESFANQEAPLEVKGLQQPLLRRQVWLQCGQETLAWAESWWNQVEAEEHLQNKDQPIWKSLTQDRSELFREVDGLALVNCHWLESKFDAIGPFWSRHYRFFRRQKELTVIREVFNPSLEKWLGSTSREEVRID